MPDSIINERFLLGEKLGEGGMAIVYQATDLESRQDLALKLILDHRRRGAGDRVRASRNADRRGGQRSRGNLLGRKVGESIGANFDVARACIDLSKLDVDGRQDYQQRGQELLDQLSAVVPASEALTSS